MNESTRLMLLIRAVDPDARLIVSEFTQKWYVVASLDESDGVMLGGVNEHRDNPDTAVAAYFDAMVKAATGPGTVLVSHGGYDNRKHWRWNGACFTEEPVEWFARSRQVTP